MSRAVATRSAAVTVPTRAELESITPADRWHLEDKLGEAQGALRGFNDDELRRWVEVEGKTQTEIAKLVGRDQSTISYRCARLGIEVPKGKGTAGGRPKQVMDVHNPGDDEEVLDGEVVDEGYDDVPQSRPTSEPSPRGPAYSDPGPRVKCPTCGHMVKPDDIGAWRE
jgi:hypothetical protein